jgi:hypothetical protein
MVRQEALVLGELVEEMPKEELVQGALVTHA